MALNRDLGPPTGEPDKLPVDFSEIYSGILKTYWVKKQILNEDLTYSFDGQMPAQATMHIPKVVRFIHTYGDDEDIALAWCSVTDDGELPKPPCPTEILISDLGLPYKYIPKWVVTGNEVIFTGENPPLPLPPPSESFGGQPIGSVIYTYKIELFLPPATYQIIKVTNTKMCVATFI